MVEFDQIGLECHVTLFFIHYKRYVVLVDRVDNGECVGDWWSLSYEPSSGCLVTSTIQNHYGHIVR